MNILWALEHARLVATVERGTPLERTDDRAPLAIGRRSGTDFVLTYSLSLERGDLLVDLLCYDVEKQEIAARSRRGGKLDLLLDNLIVAAVEEVLEKTGDRLVFGSPAVAPPAGAPQVAASLEPTVEEPQPPVEPTEPPPRPILEVTKHFELALGVAPLLAVGDAGSFFSVGIASFVSGGYRLQTATGHIRLGFVAGASTFAAEGPAVSARCVLAQLGPQVSYHGGTSPGLFVRAAGGGALLAANPNDSGYLTKLLPFFSGGVGAELLLSDALGAFFELSYQLTLEQEKPIMGYTPAIAVFYRF